MNSLEKHLEKHPFVNYCPECKHKTMCIKMIHPIMLTEIEGIQCLNCGSIFTEREIKSKDYHVFVEGNKKKGK